MGAFHSSKLSRQKYPNFLDPFLGKDLSRGCFENFEIFSLNGKLPYYSLYSLADSNRR